VVEAILILALTLIAAPLRGWLERSFRSLFERETALYRDVVSRINAQSGRFHDQAALITFLESQILSALPLRRVKIAPQDEAENEAPGQPPAPPGSLQLTYPLRRDGQETGYLIVEGPEGALTSDVRAVLEVLAGQIAIAIEDCRLLEENVRLERKVAEGERLAALGQMAATVAHEVKNPLSAIKSIAQVMGEDEQVKAQHARDLSLIVGETDRLSKSVTQLLSFASKKPPAAAPSRIDELLRSLSDLFRAEAEERKVSLIHRVEDDRQLDGIQTAAIRDSLSNLIINALQVTPAGGEIVIESSVKTSSLCFSVEDTGPGVPAEVRAEIWKPFFTTKQRGTGLGLAIVRKRMEEAGGSAALVAPANGGGAKFELYLPWQDR
jgi:signal transduction histidine kinase